MIKTKPQSAFVSQFAKANVRSLRKAGMLISDDGGESQSKGATARHRMIKPTQSVGWRFAKQTRHSLSASGGRLIVDITELEQQKKKITQTQA